MTAELYAKFEVDGLTFRPEGRAADVDALVGADGLRCEWTRPQTDATVHYASWVRDLAAWETLKTQLLADGYTESGPTAVTRPVSEFDSAYRYRDGAIYFISPSHFNGWISALQ